MTTTTWSCSTSATTARATATQSTQGALEQNDVRAVVDWLERRKGPERIALLGVAMGGVAGLAESIADDRIAAVILDSTPATQADAIQASLEADGYPLSRSPGSWATLLGSLIRTGRGHQRRRPGAAGGALRRPAADHRGRAGRAHRSGRRARNCWPRRTAATWTPRSRSARQPGTASRSRRVPASTATGC